jgi:hypothetical protein
MKEEDDPEEKPYSEEENEENYSEYTKESYQSEESNSQEQESVFKLKLGDIIEIISPTNVQLHESHFFITYINEQRIQLINVATLEEVQLNINDETGELMDESITEVHLVSRSEQPGYARQNDLLQGTWIEIHIAGDIPTIITGEIVSLDEDQIEIMTFPDLQTIFIDFEYKGLPEYIPIKKIIIRDKPETLKGLATIGNLPENEITDSLSSKDPSIKYLETGEYVIDADDNAEVEENVFKTLQQIITKSKGVIYGEDLEEITQFVEIPDSQKRYGIDIQINSLLDELLSTIPTTQRSKRIMEKIHVLIERFRELRDMFSIFDENGNVRNYKKNDPNLHKPLVDHIKDMDTKLRWLMPVVSTKKKIYITRVVDGEDEELEPTSHDITIDYIDDAIIYEERLKRDVYYKNNSITEESKYVNLYRQLTDLMIPFENPSEIPNFLQNERVRANIEAIVENIDDFNSSVIHIASKNIALAKKRFVIQTYNLGLNRLVQKKQGGKDAIVSTQMTPSDKMLIKSFVMFPSSIVNYSRIDMPGTNILERANLNFHSMMLFRLLKRNQAIVPFIIDDLTKELEYDKDDEFLTNMRHYVLSDELMRNDDEGKFEQFLRTIIPKTRTLIRLVRKHIKDKLSFVSVVQSLEPYMVYSTDISYKQYMEIRYFIIEQIKERKAELEKKRKDFSFLSTNVFDVTRETMTVIRLLLEKKDILELFLTGYKMPEKDLLEKSFTSIEILEQIIKADNGTLFGKLLSSVMSSLMTPDSLTNIFEEPLDDMDRLEKIKAADCNKRILTKRYTSVGDLQKDNHSTIYYDKEFDTTPYHILDKYKDDKKKMLPEKFVGFLSENLVQKHDCPREKSIELAKQLIAGEKQVVDGEYAILEIKPRLKNSDEENELSPKEREDLEEEAEIRAKKSYYYRKKDNWVHQEDVDDQSFIDTKDMFCNMEKTCLIKRDPLGDDTCESDDVVAKRMREIAHKKITKEFDRRYEMSSEEMKHKLETDIIKHIHYIHRRLRIRAVKSEKVNNYCYALGSLLVDQEEIIQSPYIELRGLILGQNDFIKKQQDIVKLFDTFCREPLESLEEHPHWKYCKETNTKLLPDFLYELAYCYVSGGDYNLKLEEICHTHGKRSDSGNMIEDKYSGFMIRTIEYSDEEGYNEAGFKVSTHAFIEKGEDERVLENLLKKSISDQVCENPRSQMICDILSGISKNLGISINDIREIVVRVATTVCDKLIIDEAAYNKQAKKEEEKKGVKLPPYKKRANQLTIVITATALFTIIQTEIPAFSTKRVMPGCVKSFKGYPLTGEEDTSGIKYMACVINKMKAAFEPWDAISKMTLDMIFEQIKKIVSSVLKIVEVDERYLKKREFLIANPEEDIPDEHNIEKWKHFLPPIVDTNVIDGLRSVSSDFKSEFISLMKKGNKDQHKDMLVLKSKISQYSYGIVEAIQKIVKDKALILNTISTGQPFLQNACCTDKKIENPILYFIKENEEIGQYIRTIGAISKIVDMVMVVSKAPMLFDPRASTSIYPVISNTFSEKNIYAAFIFYCGLDKGKGIPTVFHPFFTEIPVGYNKKWPLQEKVEYLKKADKRFGELQLYELMRIVNKRNIVTFNEKPRYNAVEMIKDMLILFENQESPIIDEELRIKLFSVLDKYDKTKLISIEVREDESKMPEPEKEKIATINILKNALVRIINNDFKPQVLKFLKKYGKLSRTEFNRLEEFFETFVRKWASNDLYKISTFMKNTVDEMTRIFPNMLLTNISINARFPNQHIDFSDYDKIKIYNSKRDYYAPLGEFKQDRVIHLLLLKIREKFVDLRLFFENLPIQAPMMRYNREYFSLFDKETISFLLDYVFLSVIHEYIIATDDPDLIRTDIFEKKKSTREKIAEQKDISIQFQSEFPDMEEEYEETGDDMAEIQIDVGNKEELKTRVSKMLLAFINIARKNKNEIDISYDSIANAIRKRKENEKNRIVQRFEGLSKDEREIEDMKKKFKLDEWNVGQQKGLFVYDKTVSDRERMEQEKEDLIDIQKHGMRKADFMMIQSEEVMQEGLDAEDIEDLEDMEEEDPDMGFGLQSLKANFHDGQFYSDDESDDGFGDES